MRITLHAGIAGALLAIGMLVRGDAVATESLPEQLETVLDEEGLTGIAWMLIDGPGEARIGANGLRDAATASAFTADTRFHVGSLTKALLATGVLRLATEGRIDLDAPAQRYLPGLGFTNPWSDTTEVTVRHLLDHTAGLDDARLWQMFSERADPGAPLVDAFPGPARQLRIRARPGSRFSYSNAGYALLGMIIETATGERYEDYLDQHLLEPLGMHDSTFTYTTQQGEAADPTLAWGHIDDGTRYPAQPVYLRPAAQFTTTAADLARFARFLMSDGSIDGAAFIDETWMRSRGRPMATEAASEGLVAGYALGLARRDRHGVVGLCHGGNIVGFVAMLCVFPDEHKAFAYSVNTDSETARYGRLDALFVDALGIAAATPPPTIAPDPPMSDRTGYYVPAPNRFAMFEYIDRVFGALRISADGDTLRLLSIQRPARTLRPVGPQLYSADDRATTSHVLYTNDDGRNVLSDGFQTFERVPARYVIAHRTSLALGLAGLAWLLVAGLVSLVRHRGRLLGRPETPALLATLLLLLPIPFFATQSFMALGDLTPASGVLAAATLLLPFGMLMTIYRAARAAKASRFALVNGLAALFVLQWCVVLVAAGMLPLRLWA